MHRLRLEGRTQALPLNPPAHLVHRCNKWMLLSKLACNTQSTLQVCEDFVWRGVHFKIIQAPLRWGRQGVERPTPPHPLTHTAWMIENSRKTSQLLQTSPGKEG